MDTTNITLMIHIKGGKIYNFTSLVTRLEWSGDYRTPCRTLDVSIVYAVNDDTLPRKDVLMNSTCCFYVDGVELFRGNCLDIEKTTSSNEMKLIFKDVGYMLSIGKRNYNVYHATPVEITKHIFKDFKKPLQYGYLAPATTKISKIFKEKTPYDIIMTAYTMHAEANKRKWLYMVDVKLDKINIVEKGAHYLNIEFVEGKNLIDSEYNQSLESLVNSVIVRDKNGKRLYQKVNNELLSLYNIYANEVITKQDDETITDKEIKAKYKGIEKTCSITGFGDIYTRTGTKVNVRDSHTGLVGVFYVDSDTHTWEGGKHTIKLNLNFENVMDEKLEYEDDDKKESGGGFAKDWGHGITAEMMNKVLKGPLSGMGQKFVQLGNAFGVNPMLVAMMIRIESRPTMNSGLALKGNNFGGINWSSNKNNYATQHYGKIWMGDRYYVKFPSVEAGIEYQFYLLARNYIRAGKKTIKDIIMTYAPPKENDSTAYINNLKKFYKDNTGVTWKESLLGKGVGSMEEGRNGMVAKSGNSNDIIEHAIKFCIDHLGTPYSQKDRNSYKRNPSKPDHFDCSAMVYYAYADAGKLNKRPTNAWTSKSVHSSPGSYGLKYVPLSQAKRGDVLWMSGHLGLYLGNGKAIESTSPRSRYCSSKKFTCAYRFKDF